MSKQLLNGADVCPILQKMRSETMTQRMRCDTLSDAGLFRHGFNDLLNRALVDRLRVAGRSRKQPHLRHLLLRSAILSQSLEKFRREHDVSILSAFTQPDANRHADC